jgi:hypothetical protein
MQEARANAPARAADIGEVAAEWNGSQAVEKSPGSKASVSCSSLCHLTYLKRPLAVESAFPLDSVSVRLPMKFPLRWPIILSFLLAR